MRRHVLRPGERLCAPHLLDVEVVQVLRRFERAGAIGSRRAQAALIDLAEMSLARYPHVPLLPRIWELRANLTGYDAAYVALAEVLARRCSPLTRSSPRHQGTARAWR